MRSISSELIVTLAATVRWAHDFFGNAVATATVQAMSADRVIESRAQVQLDAVASSSAPAAELHGLVRAVTERRRG